MKKYFILTILCLFAFAGFAQKKSTTLIIDAQSGEHLSLVLGGLLDPQDSSILRAVQSDDHGLIQHNGTENTDAIIQMKYFGYDTYSHFLPKGQQWPDTIRLVKSGITLKDVQITGEKVAIQVKEDTVQFNASAFKTRPNDMAEDLLKKLPGIQVESDGTVKNQGEQVTKITIDGKPFFGNDPKLATKNIPADAIDKVQVFERKSEQSSFSGFDDGSSERSINFTLKPDKRKARFGRIEAGAGTEGRYESSGTLFDFNQGRQLAVLGMSNNANKSGFTPDDAMSFSNANGGNQGGPGGPGGPGMRGPSIGGQSIFSLLGSSNVGINQNTTLGTNFRDTWGKVEFTGSYFFANTNNEGNSQTHRQTFIEGGTLLSDGTTRSNSSGNNHRVNLGFEYNIDKNNSIKFEPSLNFSDNNSANNSLSVLKNINGVSLNDVDAGTNSNSKNMSLAGDLLYRHKFAQEGRTISLRVSPKYSTADNTTTNKSFTSIFQDSLTVKDSLDQRVLNDQNGSGLSSNLSYTEPIGKSFSLEFSYNYNLDKNARNRETFDYNSATGLYDLADNTLSNNFDNTYETHRPQVSLQYKKEKYTITLSGAMQRASLQSESISDNLPFSRNYSNFLPGLHARFTLAKNKSVMVAYRTSTQQPAIDDIQPVPDLSDPLRIKIGNPNLGQEYRHFMRINYRLFDMQSNTFLSFGVRGDYTNDKIVSNVAIDQFGVETTNKENADGVYSGSFFANFGKPYRKINLNISSFTNYRRDVSFINKDRNKGDVWSTSGRLYVNYNITDFWDFDLGGSVTYNEAKYSLRPTLNNNYTDLNTEFNTTADLPLKFRVSTNINFTQRQGLTGGFTRSFTIWNASITKTFLANNSFEVSLSAYDILKQNTAVNRNVTSSYIEDYQALSLSQYFMLTARYYLNKQAPTMSKTGQRYFKMFRH